MAEKLQTFKVKAGEFVFEFEQTFLDEVNVVEKAPHEFNLIKNFKSVNAKVISCDSFCKHMRIEVEGETFDIEIKDDLDQMLDMLGFSTVSTRHTKEVKAPMPGLVLNVVVAAGQSVVEGEKLLILEAMKMENTITVPVNATIKQVLVKPGQAVEKGQILVELE